MSYFADAVNMKIRHMTHNVIYVIFHSKGVVEENANVLGYSGSRQVTSPSSMCGI